MKRRMTCRRWQSFSSRLLGVAAVTVICTSASAASPQAWLTSADHRGILERVPLAPSLESASATIAVDPTRRFQSIDGFGFTLTGGSAQLLARMSPAARHALLMELFGRGPGNIGVSWLRISIGSSDLDDHVFTYDDLSPGDTDPALGRFSLAPDERALIPVLHEILGIAPHLPVLASPWSMPGWMKTNGQSKGGTLKPGMDDVFARYLVDYVHGMKVHGVPIAAVTLQNEPENANNTPSMLMTAQQQAELIAVHVGPAFRAAGIATRIIAFDHNCDHPDYPLTVLGDSRASVFVAGTGFHLYAGNPSAMTRVHDAHPDEPVWLTEQMVIDNPKTGAPTPVAQPVAHVIAAALSNWAQGVLLWNLAADPHFGPHSTDGGCAICEGAVTLDGDKVSRNVAYAALAPFARFVPPGSVRIATSSPDADVAVVGFRTPDRATVLVLANTASAEKSVRLTGLDAPVTVSVPAGGTLTVRWTPAT